MDFPTARQFILNQTIHLTPEQQPFLYCLRRGEAPIPGQVTSLLLALKVVGTALQGEPTLDRVLAHGLFALAYESRQWFIQGQAQGVDWPPLLAEDVERLAQGVLAIFADGAGG